MSKPIFKMMKVFDCQWNPGMPEDVRHAFFSFYECGNDVWVSWTIADEVFSPEDATSEHAINKKKIDDWLIANGANGPKDNDSDGETVLIKHWW